MVILFGGEKGGTGKTTLATNLAAFLATQEMDVLLVDIDPQGSSATWANTRWRHSLRPLIPCVQISGDISRQIWEYNKKHEYIVIDAGGGDTAELQSALRTADVFCMPIKPSQLDLWTVQRMDELRVETLGVNGDMETYAILSMAPANPALNEAGDAVTALQDYPGIHIAPVLIQDRKSYRDAARAGKSVAEIGDPKASREILRLASFIFGIE